MGIGSEGSDYRMDEGRARGSYAAQEGAEVPKGDLKVAETDTIVDRSR